MRRPPGRRAALALAVLLLAPPGLALALPAQAGEPASPPAPTGETPPPAPPPKLIGRTIRDVRIEAPTEAFRVQAEQRYLLDLAGLRTGEPLARNAVRLALERIYQTGKWRGIAVEGSPVGPDGVALRLVLAPTERIAAVRYEGPRVVTRGELDTVVDLEEGQEFRPERIARATRVIQDYLDRIGYPDAVVVSSSRPFGEPLEREITIAVTPNEPCRITAVRLEGLERLAASVRERLRAALGIDVGDLCNRPRIDEGVEQLGAELRELGYREATVASPAIDYGPERRTAALSLAVRPGARIVIDFEERTARGVDPIRCDAGRLTRWARRYFGECAEARRLRDALDLGHQPDLGDEGLSAVVDRLVAYLRQQGFAWASVAARTDPLEDGRRIVFRIDRGPRLTVRGVHFRGNAEVPRDDLLDQMLTRRRAGPFGLLSPGVFLQGEFEEDLEAIRSDYRRRGFLDMQVRDVDLRFSSDRKNMWITITVDEGPRYFVTGVEVAGAEALPRDALRGLPIGAGQPFSLAAVDQATEWLVQRLASHGYLSPGVAPDIDLTPSPPAARVRFTLSPGRRTVVGAIIYRGNYYTRTSILRREMQVDPGDPYDPSAILESQREIGRVGFLRNVSIRPAEEAAGGGLAVSPVAPEPEAAPDPSPSPVQSPSPVASSSPGMSPSPAASPSPGASPEDRPIRRDLVVSVEEANRVDLGFGFDYSLEERLRAFGDVSFRNLFGTDRSVTLRGLAGDRESLYALEYRQPYLFDRRLDGRLALTYQDRDEENFSFRRSALTASVQRDLTPSIRLSLAYNLESTETFDVAPGTILDPREDIGTIRIGSVTPTVVWDRRDDPFNPGRGSLNTLTVEGANELLASEAEFVRAVVGSAWFLPLERTRRVVLAVSFRGGWAEPYGQSEEVPLIRRFFLGGSNTVRGFELDSISPRGADGALTGGTAYVNENIELRAPLPFGFGGAIFLDAGQVWQQARDVDLLDQRTAAGLGLRYITPVGPIRLDYGYKLDRQPGESIGEFHFSIGYVF